ncbi:unnamed protein product [Dovyalis caffra]|uniref:Uncharacterized protein n=1 Tax=Dovyalis caffra TaxID=77055 RepID=A0AAV1RIJ5_9ROSI|nr:unnamed protein product [Dovyalis caffra]
MAVLELRFQSSFPMSSDRLSAYSSGAVLRSPKQNKHSQVDMILKPGRTRGCFPSAWKWSNSKPYTWQGKRRKSEFRCIGFGHYRVLFNLSKKEFDYILLVPADLPNFPHEVGYGETK